MDNDLDNESPLYEKDPVSEGSTNLKSLFLFMSCWLVFILYDSTSKATFIAAVSIHFFLK